MVTSAGGVRSVEVWAGAGIWAVRVGSVCVCVRLWLCDCSLTHRTYVWIVRASSYLVTMCGRI